MTANPPPQPSPPNWANKWSFGLAALTMLGGVIWFFASLNARVEMMQTRPLEAVEAPARTRTAAEEAEGTCRDLAVRVANAYAEGNFMTVARPLESLMDRMGCTRPGAETFAAAENPAPSVQN